MRPRVPALLLGSATLLAATTVPATAGAATPGTFTVVLEAHSVTSDGLAAIRDAGGTVTDRIDQIGVVEARTADSTAFLSALVGAEGIASVGPSLTVPLDVPLTVDQQVVSEPSSSANPTDYTWNIDRVTDDGLAWQHETGTHDVVVGVIDTGFDFDHPDLAPNIVGGSKTFVPGTPTRGMRTSTDGCAYGWAAGTSMAAPHVAGVAALIIADELERTGTKPSPAQVARTLEQIAEDVGKVGYDGLYGHGLVDATEAVGP